MLYNVARGAPYSFHSCIFQYALYFLVATFLLPLSPVIVNALLIEPYTQVTLWFPSLDYTMTNTVMFV
jgi:hypothetical protein